MAIAWTDDSVRYFCEIRITWHEDVKKSAFLASNDVAHR